MSVMVKLSRAHFDRTFLAQVVGGSTAVTLAEGETRTQDLRVR